MTVKHRFFTVLDCQRPSLELQGLARRIRAVEPTHNQAKTEAVCRAYDL